MKKQDLPTLKPTCNTSFIRRRVLFFDYIMISFTDAAVRELGAFLFPYLVEDYEVWESSMSGFSKVMTNGYVFFHYDNKGTKDVVLLEIKGQGCRFMEQQENHSWYCFFKQVSEIGKFVSVQKVGIKRIDVAVDSFHDDTLTPKRALNYLKMHLITSRFRSSQSIHEYQISNGNTSGESIYFGKRASDLSLIIYDKCLETKSDFCWFRTEIRFKNVWGLKLVNALLDQAVSFPIFLSDVLKNNLQFRSSIHKRSELRRRPIAAWYGSYLKYISNQHLYCLDRLIGDDCSNVE